MISITQYMLTLLSEQTLLLSNCMARTNSLFTLCRLCIEIYMLNSVRVNRVVLAPRSWLRVGVRSREQDCVPTGTAFCKPGHDCVPNVPFRDTGTWRSKPGLSRSNRDVWSACIGMDYQAVETIAEIINFEIM